MIHPTPTSPLTCPLSERFTHRAGEAELCRAVDSPARRVTSDPPVGSAGTGRGLALRVSIGFCPRALGAGHRGPVLPCMLSLFQVPSSVRPCSSAQTPEMARVYVTTVGGSLPAYSDPPSSCALEGSSLCFALPGRGLPCPAWLALAAPVQSDPPRLDTSGFMGHKPQPAPRRSRVRMLWSRNKGYFE